jgi:hypothetical protein
VPVVAVALVVIGATIPQWGRRLAALAAGNWVRQRRAYRTLRPLWLDVYRASPGIALTPPESRLRELLALRDLEFRLYRRVIEIRDGRLALLPYLDESAADVAARFGRREGLSGDDLEAVVEAARIAAALESKAAGRPPRRGGRETDVHGGHDLETEVTWLERVARAYVDSPVVRRALDSVDREPSTEALSPP